MHACMHACMCSHHIVSTDVMVYLSLYTGATIGFTQTQYSVSEDMGPVVLVVEVLFGELSEEVTVGFTTQNDTAIGEYALLPLVICINFCVVACRQ